MNRLSPLIVRRSLSVPSTARPRSSASAVNWQPVPFEGADAGKWLEELKLFATGWIGGLIFFGTYLG